DGTIGTICTVITLRAYGAIRTIGAVRTVIAGRALWALGSGRAVHAVGTICTINAGRTLRALGACRTRGPLRPHRTICTISTICPVITGRALRSGRSGRPSRDVVDLALQVGQRCIDRGERTAHVVVVAALDRIARRGEDATGKRGAT